ncbi:MAG: 3-hydroxyacyl-CoA dehydrogenase NAD-binding domain-containing protein [Gemmatimonadota bacterium]
MSALSLVNDNGVAVITFDLPGEPVNKFSRAVRDEFLVLLNRIDADASIVASVIMSGKEDTFVAGADIEEFLTWTTTAQAEAASREGHQMLDRLEGGAKPTVAAIHGACVGGGLEMALACAWRVATEHPKTLLALPEVQLGLIPGAGGTQRLPRTVGLRAALDMILTGRNVRAAKALRTGLVHEVVHPAILRETAVRRARELASGERKRGLRKPAGITAFVLDRTAPGRAIVFGRARRETMEKTRGHYPAPLAAIDAVAAGFTGRESGFREEARRFGEMAMTAVARELIFIFFATTSLKKDTGPGDAPPIRKLGVVGAGFMGAGIAAVAVQGGVQVRMRDSDAVRVGKGLAAIADVLGARLRKGQITRRQYDDSLLLAGGTIDYSGFASAEVVIEAVFEDLDVKHTVIREIESVVSPHTVVASNTSTIPISAIATASASPERIIGMHFFSPVHRMPLLEVIVTPRTAQGVTATAVACGRQLGKTVIVVNDSPGFYVNRILAPYINEAGRFLDAGVGVDAIDSALADFGFPVGPITLLDEVGLDIAGKSGAIFHAAFGERLAPSMALRRVVESGRLGRKGKSGFYTYDERGNRGAVDQSVYGVIQSNSESSDMPAAEIVNRCVLGLVNEAVRCLEEGIIRSARDGDIGAVFGIGFPPFRGGPFRYVDATGAARIVDELETLNGRFVGRFEPTALLLELARRKERFYPSTGRPL